jgi:hypothetical protein
MGSANKQAKNEARRARIEDMRRAEQARERRITIITITAIVAVVLATAGGGWYLWSSAENDRKAEEEAKTSPISGVRTWDDLSQDHVETKVDYPMSPPVGGDHHPAWANCDSVVYTEEIANENAVHSLEHGAVWITYNDKAAKEDVESLSDLVSKTSYSFMSPYKDQSSPIALTAWGAQLQVDKASDPKVETFLTKYVQGEQTPEPGAACTGGVGA